MEKWLSTLDTREAAAFAALGVTVKIISSLHERTGRKVVRFLLAPLSDDGAHATGRLRVALKSGALAREQPAHPLIVIFRAYHNREAILSLIHSGAFHRLVPCAGGIWQYVPGDDGLPGLSAAVPAVRTRDLNLCAALATVGLPLLKLDGRGDAREFTLAAFGPPGVDGASLTEQWRRDPAAVPFSLPFAQAARGLRARSILRREVDAAIATVLISKPGTRSHAAIRADASPKAWDIARRFLTGI